MEDDMGRWAADWSESLSPQAERAWRLSRQVAELEVTAEGAHGAVEATVAGSGVLTDLRLTEAAMQMTAARLAETILDTMRRAQGLLAERVTQLAIGTVGVGSPAGRAVAESYAHRFPPVDGFPSVDSDHGRR